MVLGLLVLMQWPIQEVARPLVAEPGMSEVEVAVAAASASRWYDADSRTRAMPPGSASSAATAEIAGRYGLFQGLEVSVALPWIARLDPAGGDPVSGAGRAELGARYELPWPGTTWTETGERIPPPFRVSGDVAVVLPSTARRLRTDDAGVVHKDHLAAAGAVRVKHHVSDHAAAHAFAGFIAPFANAEDREAERDPPSSFTLSAGSTYQATARLWADVTASFTRTNRDRVAGGVVPRTDQFLVRLEPAAGLAIARNVDVAIRLAVPLAGKNTPQSFTLSSEARVRF